MYKKGICEFNGMIDCEHHDKCTKCNWNPTYFEAKKRSLREERLSKVKDNEKRTML